MLLQPSKLKLTLFLSVLSLGGAGSSAFAQQASEAYPGGSTSSPTDIGAIQEIVVTAQRRSEKLLDVPITVQAISAKELEAAGITSNRDLPVLTPGLVFGEQAGYAQPFLRGIGSIAIGPGIENPVALYVDGVYYGASIGSILSFNNISQVEVDKGPQGTLFGRNATGGLIQVTTKDPTQLPGGSIEASYGDYQTAGADLYVTGGVFSNLATDLSVHFSDQGEGYGKNLYTDEPLSKTRDLAARNKWLLVAPDGTTLRVIFDYDVTHFIPNYGPAPGTTPLGAPAYPVPPQDTAGIYQPYGVTHQGGASLQLQHDFSLGRFVSITGYREVTLDSDSSASLSVDPAFAIASDLHQESTQFSQELQFSSLPASPIKWTTGAYFYDENGGIKPAVVTGGLISPLSYLNIYDDQRDISGAIYGQSTIKILPATNLTFGLRYTIERKEFDGAQSFGFPGAGAEDISDQERKTFHQLTWRLALDHHFGPDDMVYLSYNRGFKSGGFNDSLVPTTEFQPEMIDAYEAGTKALILDRRVSLDASVFLYKYKNIQAFRLLEDGNADIYNAAAATLYGIDADAKWRVTSKFSLTAALELLHSRYDAFPLAPISSPMIGGGTSYSAGSVAGNDLPFAPRVTTSLTADYTMPLDVRGALTLTGTYAYNNGFFGEPDNRLRQSAYNLFNAQVAWSSADRVYTVRFWGRNLTDSQYVTALGSQANGDFANFAAPRTFGMAVSRRF